jgi:hypothetical protein
MLGSLLLFSALYFVLLCLLAQHQKRRDARGTGACTVPMPRRGPPSRDLVLPQRER